MEALPPLPAHPTTAAGGLLSGLWAGSLAHDPIRLVRRRGGRVRRWSYAAAAGGSAAVGAAIVDVGVGGTAFVWLAVGEEVHTWQHTAITGRAIRVAPRPSATSSARTDGATVVVGARGSLRVDVPVGGRRLRVSVAATATASSPVTCATPTPGGGWNITCKHAGYPTEGWARHGDDGWPLDLGGWADWTAGRQDRRTSWRWAAAAGRSQDGRRVGLNLSTGMNGAVGEDVVWWDGRPYPLDVRELAPVDGLGGPWTAEGPGWELRFETSSVRAARENLLLLRSRYVQPIGRFTGTLPDPAGAPAVVTLTGVTEDHHAVW